MFDFLKRKELNEISRLKEDIKCLNNRLSWYQHLSSIEVDTKTLLSERERSLNEIDAKKQDIEKEIETNRNILNSVKLELKSIKDEIAAYSDISTIRSVGLYSFKYKFQSSDIYKGKLEEIRRKEKSAILDGEATTCHEEWTVDGSVSKGEAFTKKMSKIILRCFNNECDTVINRVKYNSVDIYKEKITKIFKSLNNVVSFTRISITDKYLKLKIDELTLAYEYELKKHQEQEERRIERERAREEEKLLKEIEERRKDIEKELNHYNRQIEQLNVLKSKSPAEDLQHLEDRSLFIEERINELNREIEEMDFREANKKAGYVYVISNIGSFGENVYKIGMTRRLEPKDRIDELSCASVPFKFDIHAMIFCEDAPKLEAELHKAFDKYKVNAVNSRKEFFRVDIEKIKEEVRNNYDKTVEFIDSPYSEQYIETMKLKAEH